MSSYILLAGAPDFASTSGEFMAGNERTSLGEAKGRSEGVGPLSHSVEMLQGSSKDSLGDTYVDQDQAPETPKPLPPPAQDIPPAQEPPPTIQVLEESQCKSTVAARPSQAKLVAPSPGLPSPSSVPASVSPDVRRQLFGPKPAAPSKASQAPKPEGYWKLLATIYVEVQCNHDRGMLTPKGPTTLPAQLQG